MDVRPYSSPLRSLNCLAANFLVSRIFDTTAHSQGTQSTTDESIAVRGALLLFPVAATAPLPPMAVVSDDHACEKLCVENLAPSSAPMQTGPRPISADEVKQHSGADGPFWAVIDGFVVDATAFVKTHPGGLKKLLSTDTPQAGATGRDFGFSFSRGRNAHFPETDPEHSVSKVHTQLVSSGAVYGGMGNVGRGHGLLHEPDGESLAKLNVGKMLDEAQCQAAIERVYPDDWGNGISAQW
ncbi:hypothetical protein CYMTET_22588 [Cymbomonas tetramitiformis]|uniref:Cytochrome b5 heme-binding domain-containing protein n=1 Tax=Cymbomonas tetramitiformis TaxID=36881 RepID=A0AAE0G106_9CHLO|nr:hypothetical protein CYMTET_22588 [Cymbomonas tetramitiformis]